MSTSAQATTRALRGQIKGVYVEDTQQDPQPMAQNEDGATVDTAVTSPVAEPTTEQQEQSYTRPSDSDAPEQSEEEQPSDGHRPSRAERRIKQLNEKIRQAASQPEPSYEQLPVMPQYMEGQEVSPQQLQADVVQTANAIAALQVQQQFDQRDAMSNFERDTDVIAKMPELDASSDLYSQELEEAIAQEFQERAFQVIGYDQANNPITRLNKNVRLKDIAERHIRAARALAEKYSNDMRNKTAALADETAIPPNGEKPEEKKFEDLSIEEMEKRLGFGPGR